MNLLNSKGIGLRGLVVATALSLAPGLFENLNAQTTCKPYANAGWVESKFDSTIIENIKVVKENIELYGLGQYDKTITEELIKAERVHDSIGTYHQVPKDRIKITINILYEIIAYYTLYNDLLKVKYLRGMISNLEFELTK